MHQRQQKNSQLHTLDFALVLSTDCRLELVYSTLSALSQSKTQSSVMKRPPQIGTPRGFSVAAACFRRYTVTTGDEPCRQTDGRTDAVSEHWSPG